MSRSFQFFAVVGLITSALVSLPLVARTSVAQDEEPTPRVLAPGVLTVIEPHIRVDESVSNYRPLIGIDTVPFTPNEAPITETLDSRVKRVIFRHDVYCYEFAYKPLRMIKVDVPQPSGRMQEKLVWYLVYRVRNLGVIPAEMVDENGNTVTNLEGSGAIGNELIGERNGEDLYDIVPKDQLDDLALHGRFFPSFVLEGWADTGGTDQYDRKAYLDRVIPAAVDDIQAAEDPALTFYNSVEITAVDIPAAPTDENQGVWGVATWEDIDPRIDYCSIYVQGISNAYEVRESADGSRSYRKKTLQLNFWRPGDTLDETRDDIHVGVPLVDAMREQVEITTRYELPGPVVIASRYDDVTNRSEQLFVLDPLLNEDLDSRLQIQMLGGSIPTSAIDAFAEFGIDVPSTIALTEAIQNREWRFSVDVDGETQNFRLRYTPLYWEKVGQEILYLDRLDYLWIYR